MLFVFLSAWLVALTTFSAEKFMRCPDPPEMIYDTPRLATVGDTFAKQQRLVAVDTESNSMHAYQ